MSLDLSSESERLAALRLSSQFHRLAEICSRPPVTFDDLLSHVTSRSHGLLVLLLAVPFLIPIPLPGVSVPFGLLIMLAAIRMMFHLPPWIPQRWRKQTVPHALLNRIFSRAERLMQKLETKIRPRGLRWVTKPSTRVIGCTLIALNGLLLALPLPPGTNFPPALPCVLLAIGFLEEDGVFLGIGIAIGVLVVTLFSMVPIFGWQAIKAMLAI